MTTAPSATPAAVVVEPQRPGYRSAAVLARCAIGAACAVAVLEVVEAILAFPAADAYVAAARGDRVESVVITAYDLALVPGLGLLLLAYVLTCLWLQRARENAESLNPAHHHERATGWVWGGWVAPIVSFWLPYRIIDDVRRANPIAAGSGSMLRVWWGGWLVYLLSTQVASTLIPWSGVPDESSARSLGPVETVNALACVAALVAWVVVVRSTGQDQERAATAVSPLDPGASAPGTSAWKALATGALALSICCLLIAVVVLKVRTVDLDAGPSPAGAGASDGTSPTQPRETTVSDLGKGDCLAQQTSAGAVLTVEVLSCSSPHAEEVYAVFALGDGPYPGDRRVAQLAQAGCSSRFQRFVGLSVAESALAPSYYYPRAESWAADTNVTCLVRDDSLTTGSLQGSRR